jgi:glycosyltransferase involved in cell wall biosynthesis
MSCDVVAVTALQNAVDAASHGIEPTRIIPVGVDSSFLQSNEPTGGLPTVLCVGRIEPRKNQTFVAEHTPDAYALRLVGPQSSAYAERIPRFEEVWDGLLSPDDLARAYHRADIFVLPSVFEGFGLTAVEAMAAGTPVVVADTCGIADHVYDEPIGEVYRFDDPDTYLESLRLVRDRMEEYGRNARSYVEENLTWQTIAAQYEREYARSVRK